MHHKCISRQKVIKLTDRRTQPFSTAKMLISVWKMPISQQIWAIRFDSTQSDFCLFVLFLRLHKHFGQVSWITISVWLCNHKGYWVWPKGTCTLSPQWIKNFSRIVKIHLRRHFYPGFGNYNYKGTNSSPVPFLQPSPWSKEASILTAPQSVFTQLENNKTNRMSACCMLISAQHLIESHMHFGALEYHTVQLVVKLVPIYISKAEKEQVTSFRFLSSVIKEKLLRSNYISTLTKKAHKWLCLLAPFQCVKAKLPEKCRLCSGWFKPARISVPTKHMWQRWGLCTEPKTNQKTTPIPARACSTCSHLADIPVSLPAPQETRQSSLSP